MKSDMLKNLKNKVIQITNFIKDNVYFKLLWSIGSILYTLFDMLMFLIGVTVFYMALATSLGGSESSLKIEGKHGNVDLFIQTKPSAKKD